MFFSVFLKYLLYEFRELEVKYMYNYVLFQVKLGVNDNFVMFLNGYL